MSIVVAPLLSSDQPTLEAIMEAILAFGDVLRTARVKAGVSLKQLASYLGLSVPYMSDIERNRRGILSRERILVTANLLSMKPFLLLVSAAETFGFIATNDCPAKTRETIGMILFGADAIKSEHWDKIACIISEDVNHRWTRVREGVVAMPRSRRHSKKSIPKRVNVRGNQQRAMEEEYDSGSPAASVVSHDPSRIHSRKVSSG